MNWQRGRRVTAGLVLAWATTKARTHEVSEFEASIFETFNRAPSTLHAPAWAVMQSGSLGSVFVTAAATMQRSGRSHALRVLIAGTAVWAGVKAVKPRVGRGRPHHHLDQVIVRGKPQTGLGYPSGHAAVATALALLTARTPTERRMALCVAAVTGATRMYVGAHLPLDIVGGHLIGALAASAACGVRTTASADLASGEGPGSRLDG